MLALTAVHQQGLPAGVAHEHFAQHDELHSITWSSAPAWRQLQQMLSPAHGLGTIAGLWAAASGGSCHDRQQLPIMVAERLHL